ncbi:MAG: hypothetical protein Q4F67_01660, partial [Propionibacteriaceae bacterium]|nr:hypothetical protein [Propionibacteriaceae bacterium]
NIAPADPFSTEQLTRQLDFAAQASPDGKVWDLRLAGGPDGPVTTVHTTGFDTVDGNHCEVGAVTLPAPDDGQQVTPGTLCSDVEEMNAQRLDATFEPGDVDPEALAQGLAEVRKQLGDEFTILTVAHRDGPVVEIRAQNPEDLAVVVPVPR